ncbi:class I SAM-dependent methyltransferase [Parasphingorhabdus sp.]|uniref:class I SAM-dependent methyltransferase n=1 Tax=Parasphingorhabdus sp. TaxID=2709688 RepID=UPI0032652B53
MAVSGTEGYAEQARSLLAPYENCRTEEVHADFLPHFPTLPSQIIDIGSGTGRDAAWFAGNGHKVLAVEPTAELRETAARLHPSQRIDWLDDSLPELAIVRKLKRNFDLVMMSAVWMHLNESARRLAMVHITSIMAPSAKLFITLRHGPVPEDRIMYNVSAEETINLASQNGLELLLNTHGNSIQPQNKARGVTWNRLAFQNRPDSAGQ